MAKRECVMTIEMPDTVAKVDFLGKYGCTLNIELEGNQLWITVIADDDVCTIIEDKVYTIPESEEDSDA